MSRENDWVTDMFPGDGLEIPTDDERDRADALIAEWSTRWAEASRTIPRSLHGRPSNRAFLRSRLRLWWKLGKPIATRTAE